jgi:hypothetical protein
MSNPTAARCEPPAPPPQRALPPRAALPQIAGQRPISIILAAKRPKHSPFMALNSVRILAAGSGKVVGPPRPVEPPGRGGSLFCTVLRFTPRCRARVPAVTTAARCSAPQGDSQSDFVTITCRAIEIWRVNASLARAAQPLF